MKSIVVASVSCICAVCLTSCTRPRTGTNGVAGQGLYDAGPISLSKFTWPPGKRAAISLTFDDARASQLDVGIPILDQYGFKATFCVSTGPVQQRVREWRNVVSAGHEIGNHSMRHPCTGNFPWARNKALEDYALEAMAAEIDQANVTIEGLLSVRPVTYAYPCGQKFVGRGEDLRSYVPLVARRFLAGRGWRDEGANDPAFCDLAQLMGMELDGLSFGQLKAMVDEAATKGFWLVLCGHEIGTGGRQTTRAETLMALCEYARDPNNGLWLDTVANVARYVAEQRRPAVSP